MKYLKRYNESREDNKATEVTEEIMDECRDILIELDDLRLKTGVFSHLNSRIGHKGWISIFIERESVLEYSELIIEVISRLELYLKPKGFKARPDIEFIHNQLVKEKFRTISIQFVLD